MRFVDGPLTGTYVVELKKLDDGRGSFVKTFSASVFENSGIRVGVLEEFYSVSAKNVVRGMHFQTPPRDHEKIVFCAAGSVLDVLVDLRAGSSYGCSGSVLLDARQPKLLIIPRGIAHGFRSLEHGSLMVYKTSTEHDPAHDAGIRWDSFGFDWGIAHPILSSRDEALPLFKNYASPF